MPNLGIPELLILVGFFGFFVLGTAFWIWMLVDCAKYESSVGNEKVVWILILVFTHWIGATIYYFVRRSPRRTVMAR